MQNKKRMCTSAQIACNKYRWYEWPQHCPKVCGTDLHGPVGISEERHGFQVFFDDGIHDDLEDHLHVGGVGGRGEVMVDEFAGRRVEGYEHGGDEAGGRVYVTVCSCKQKEVTQRILSIIYTS